MNFNKLRFFRSEGGRTCDKLAIGDKVLISGKPYSLGTVTKVLKASVKVVDSNGDTTTYKANGEEYGESYWRYVKEILLYPTDGSFEEYQKEWEKQKQKEKRIKEAKLYCEGVIKELHRDDESWVEIAHVLKGLSLEGTKT